MKRLIILLLIVAPLADAAPKWLTAPFREVGATISDTVHMHHPELAIPTAADWMSVAADEVTSERVCSYAASINRTCMEQGTLFHGSRGSINVVQTGIAYGAITLATGTLAHFLYRRWGSAERCPFLSKCNLADAIGGLALGYDTGSHAAAAYKNSQLY